MPPLTTAVNPRQPLAVTSINAILNNPTPAEPTGKPIVSVKPVVTVRNTPDSLSVMQAAVPCQKRKASEVEDVSTENAPEIHPNDPRLHHIDQNCDQIRRKINTLLNSGEMKVGEFIKTINVNSKSYGSFMKLSGPTKGSANGTYSGAFAFFKRRELMGFKAPKKARVSREVERGLLDVSMVKLEGEEDMEVPVYETCDSIRRQITAFLREPGITQAAFLREIAKSFPDGRKDPQSKVLKDFLGKSGAKAGNTSAIFYGSYVFFEKMRIRDGKPKSKFREEMERIYAGGDGSSDEDECLPGRRVRKGIDIKRAGNGKFWCMQGERPTEDQYGRVSFRRG